MHERIITGDWPPHRKILSQHDPAQVFDTSPHTIRVAVAELRRRGYLTNRPHKKGTYVRPSQDWDAC